MEGEDGSSGRYFGDDLRKISDALNASFTEASKGCTQVALLSH